MVAQATEIVYLGECAKGYPLFKGKTAMSNEALRDIAHLRPRTNKFSATLRVRNSLAFATHEFFNKAGFYYMHAPLITASDCEGAGEMFQVTTLIKEGALPADTAGPSKEEVTAKEGDVSKAQGIVDEKIAAGKNKKSMKGDVKNLEARKKELEVLNKKPATVAGIPVTPDREIDYTNDFFGQAAFLTVSGQLQAEIGACALSNVYTFGPTFRAEYSFTSRHLAEFWMIEPELVFADLNDDMRLAEDYVRYCCQYLLDNNMDEMEYFADPKWGTDPEALNRLRLVASSTFERCSYTKAIKILQEVLATGHIFDKDDPKGKDGEKQHIEWGIDMASEHERYLCEVVFKKPVIVYNYPCAIKAFYMRRNDPGTDGAPGPTCAAMDVLVPGVGELIGGSVREERHDVLVDAIKETGRNTNAPL